MCYNFLHFEKTSRRQRMETPEMPGTHNININMQRSCMLILLLPVDKAPFKWPAPKASDTLTVKSQQHAISNQTCFSQQGNTGQHLFHPNNHMIALVLTYSLMCVCFTRQILGLSRSFQVLLAPQAQKAMGTEQLFLLRASFVTI